MRLKPPLGPAHLLDLDAEVAKHRRHGVDVLDDRDVEELDRLVGEQRRRHRRQGGVLAAGDREGAGQLHPAGDVELLHPGKGTPVSSVVAAAARAGACAARRP